MRVIGLLSLAVLAGLGAGSPGTGSSRRILARPFVKDSCRNSASGRLYIADDQGYVCERAQLDFMTGCCQHNGLKHSCNSCTEDKCCSKYEFCVSCCLAPKNNASELLSIGYRIKNHEETGKWTDEFEYCMGKCRTHRRSTVHENAYLSKRHYCFSESARPLDKEPDIAPIPSRIEVVRSEPGDTCAKACEVKGKECNPSYFSSLNSCNVMRDYFKCEAACEFPENGRQEPCYVTSKAPKPQRPAACFIGQFGVQSQGLTACTWKEIHVQRLCPCDERNVNKALQP